MAYYIDVFSPRWQCARTIWNPKSEALATDTCNHISQYLFEEGDEKKSIETK